MVWEPLLFPSQLKFSYYLHLPDRRLPNNNLLTILLSYDAALMNLIEAINMIAGDETKASITSSCDMYLKFAVPITLRDS
jgi:hypothetical protein